MSGAKSSPRATEKTVPPNANSGRDAIIATLHAMALDRQETLADEMELCNKLANESDVNPEYIGFLFQKLGLPGAEFYYTQLSSNNPIATIFITKIIKDLGSLYKLQLLGPTIKMYQIVLNLTKIASKPKQTQEVKQEIIDSLRDLIYITLLQSADMRKCYIRVSIENITSIKLPDLDKFIAGLNFPKLDYYRMFDNLLSIHFSKRANIDDKQNPEVSPMLVEQASELELFESIYDLLGPHISQTQRRIEQFYAKNRSISTNINFLFDETILIGKEIQGFYINVSGAINKTFINKNKPKFEKIFADFNSVKRDITNEYERLKEAAIRGNKISNFDEHRALKVRLANICLAFEILKGEHAAIAASQLIQQPKATAAATKPAPAPADKATTTQPSPSNYAEEKKRIQEARNAAENFAREEAARVKQQLLLDKQEKEKIAQQAKEREIQLQAEVAASNREAIQKKLAENEREPVGAKLGPDVAKPKDHVMSTSEHTTFETLIKPTVGPAPDALRRLEVFQSNESSHAKLRRLLEELYNATSFDIKNEYTFDQLAQLAELLGGDIVRSSGHALIQFNLTKPNEARQRRGMVGINTHTKYGKVNATYVRHFIQFLQRPDTDEVPGLGITKPMLTEFLKNLDAKRKFQPNTKLPS